MRELPADWLGKSHALHVGAASATTRWIRFTDGDAARLYARLGWVRVGDIPNYALYPQGGLCATRYYYRRLG